MAASDQSPKGLSIHLSFVVQFEATTQVDLSKIAGRIEHIMSGQVAQFESWDALQSFMTRVLQEMDPPPESSEA